MAITLQDILRRHTSDYFRHHRWPPHIYRAAQQMRDYRTPAMGGQVESCPHGHVHRIYFHSCRHRSCPQCAALPSEQWLAGWKQRLLQTPHHHLVFTVPHALNPFWQYNKRLFGGLLFDAVRETLMELLADKKYMGAVPGILAALHTWGQLLPVHVHLHVLVTAGGLTEDGRWRRAKKKCLLPRKVLMRKFRGKLRSKLRAAAERGDLVLPPDWNLARFRGLLNKLGRTDWNVKILERYDHGQGVATYLANYLKGGPIKNQRILALSDGHVTFRYRDNQDVDPRTARGRRKTKRMLVDEFLSRLLEHVPPPRMQTIRASGLYASAKRADLATARELLGQAALEPVEPVRWQDLLEKLGCPERGRCPVCGAELIVESHIAPARGPPALMLEGAA